jgi:hypothetical protein
MYSCFKTFQPSAEVGKLGRSDEDCGKFLHNDACEIKVLDLSVNLASRAEPVSHLFLLKDFSERLIYTLRAEVEAQLSDYQTSTRLEQSSVCAKKIQQVDHKCFEIAVVRRGRDLGKKLQIVFDDFF